MALTNREKRLIERFVATYSADAGAAFVVIAWPDEVDRTSPAVDAIAQSPTGVQLAIEHTLLQPFTGERRDSHVFTATIAQLAQKQTLIVPGFDVDLDFAVGAVPTGVNWSSVAPAVEGWYQSACQTLPVGPSRHRVPGLAFDLGVDVWKEPTSGDGHLFISRRMPPESIESVVRQALSARLPKLVAANSDRRVLLLEKNSLPRGYGEIGYAIERLRGEFPQVARVDHAWVVNTVAWDTEDYTPSYLVWPPSEALQFQLRRRRA